MHKLLRRPAHWLLLLCFVAGLVLPWVYNLRYFAHGGSVLPGVFFRDAFANDLTAALTLDVYLAALSFCTAVACDTRMGPRRWWTLPACFLIGLAAVLPAYLLLRGTRAEQDAAPPVR